jgi:hypothetical protein
VGASFGGSPIWGTGLAEDRGKLVAGIPAYYTFEPHLGWSRKFVWNIRPGWHLPVSVQVASSTKQVTFESHDGDRTTHPTLDPGRPDRSPPGGWAEFGSYVYIPVADCYEIEANWPGGGWVVWFAAGAAG